MRRRRRLRNLGIEAVLIAPEVASLDRFLTLLVMIIGKHANKDARAWPGERLLAAEMKASVRSVRRGIRALADRRLIKVIHRGWHKTNIYIIDVERLAALPRVTGRADAGVFPEEPAERTPASPLQAEAEGTNRAHREDKPNTQRGRPGPPNGVERTGTALYVPSGNGLPDGRPSSLRGGPRPGHRETESPLTPAWRNGHGSYTFVTREELDRLEIAAHKAAELAASQVNGNGGDADDEDEP